MDTAHAGLTASVIEAQQRVDLLHSTYEPAPGLLMHDWGDSSAVVFVKGTAATHLVDGDIAEVLAAWMGGQAGPHEIRQLFAAAPDPAAALAHFAAQVPQLVQSGILVSCS